MDGNIAYMSLQNVQYPLMQITDYSSLVSYNGSAMQQVSEQSGWITPSYVSDLGTDVLHIHGWQGTTGIDILMDNYEAYFKKYQYRSGFNGIWIYDIDHNELGCVGGLPSGESNSAKWYMGVYCKDDYAWFIVVQQGANNKTRVLSNGGNNAFGKKLYTIFHSGVPANGGGAGSGYIGNSLLSNKKMVGYNVPTSSAEGTKTESVNEASATPVSGKPKSGNGFARIKYLRPKPSGGETEDPLGRFRILY